MSNSTNMPAPNKPRFSVSIQTDKYQEMIRNTLSDPETVKRFVAGITSAVATTPALQDCESSTILAGALLGESLHLAHSPQLGHYYLVPFKQKAKYGADGSLISPECTVAQFVLGYKGYIQLAIRSGNYKKLNVIEIKEGELKHFDPLNEDIDVDIIEDFDERESAPTAGYYAMFEYVNGFRKAIYWSKRKMLMHADKFSKAFSAVQYEAIQQGKVSDKDMWKYSSFWYKDFDGMAKKTMLRQLISKWGVMSLEMQTAFERDDSFNEMQNGEVATSDYYEETTIIDSPTEVPAATKKASLSDFA